VEKKPKPDMFSMDQWAKKGPDAGRKKQQKGARKKQKNREASRVGERSRGNQDQKISKKLKKEDLKGGVAPNRRVKKVGRNNQGGAWSRLLQQPFTWLREARKKRISRVRKKKKKEVWGKRVFQNTATARSGLRRTEGGPGLLSNGTSEPLGKKGRKKNSPQ